MNYYILAIAGVISYLFGSIPFSAIVPKLLNGVDTLQDGSKNPGTTNVVRTAGVKTAIICAVLDVLKGVLPMVVGRVMGFGEHYAQMLSFLAILGHCYSAFIGFKGGKGVASTAGFALAMEPWTILFFIALQGVLLFTTKYMSVASICSAITLPVLAFLIGKPIVFPFLCSLLILYRHRGNIVKLLKGTENKFTIKKKAESVVQSQNKNR